MHRTIEEAHPGLLVCIRLTKIYISENRSVMANISTKALTNPTTLNYFLTS